MCPETNRALQSENEALRARIEELEHRLGEQQQRELSNRKRIEAELQKSEAKFRQLFEQMSSGFALHEIICDEQGKPCDYRFLEVNPAFERLTSLRCEDVLGKRALEVFPTIERQWIADYGRVALTGEPARFERCAGPLGKDFEVTAFSPGPRRFALSFTDVTERKRAEDAVKRRTAQLETVHAVSVEITRDLDLASLLRSIIDRAVGLVGAAAGAVYLWDGGQRLLIPRAWHAHGDWLAELRLRLGEGVTGVAAQRREGLIVNDYRSSPYALPLLLEHVGVTASLAEPLLYRDELLGAIVVNHIASPQRYTDEDQHILRLFAAQAALAIVNARLFQQEQGRRQQLEALQAVSEEITRELDLRRLLDLILARAIDLVETTSGALFLWDEVTQVLIPDANRGLGDWYRTLRLRPGEGVAGTVALRREGLMVNDFQSSPYVLPAIQAAHPEVGQIRAALAEPLLYQGRLLGVLLVRDKTSGTAFGEADVQRLRLLAAQAAIAIENARLFAELRQSYNTLQRAQEELVRSEKLRALGQMSAGIAHDLNNMLAAVLGQVELLKLRRADPAIQTALASLETAVSDGAETVRRLQDFARQRTHTALAPVALEQLVAEAVEITRPRWDDEATRRGAAIRLENTIGPLPSLEGHGPEIREALMNLIFNAVDAMPHGGTLRFTGRHVPDEEEAGPGWVELDVSDTGIGMPAEIQSRIFDPFFTTKGQRGTGLGLSVVYGLMERHGGRITVASTPGKGSTFTLRFRAVRPAAAARTDATMTKPVARRVLVVEDEEAVRTTLVQLLAAAGHDVIEAADGPGGLELLAGQAVDCMLTDLGMPGMLGWEVARTAKALRPDLPIILLTGWGEQGAAEMGGTAAVDRILGKPVRLAELLHAIRELTTPGVAGDTRTAKTQSSRP